MNLFKTVFLMSMLTGLFLVIGALIGGGPGMIIAFALAAGMNLVAYWNSDKMLLSMYGAKQVDANGAPDLFHIVERLAAQARLPMPKVYITENPQPNAFATGR
ncbi:MAG: M48 family metalloprotease, partial [Rhizomicrobium sp.]